MLLIINHRPTLLFSMLHAQQVVLDALKRAIGLFQLLMINRGLRILFFQWLKLVSSILG